MSVEGTWDLSIATPVGRIKAVVTLNRVDGVLTGTVEGAGQEVALREVTAEGDRVTWKQAVTRPLRLNLAFDVTVDGDALHGVSRAGRLPSSQVRGVRRATPVTPAADAPAGTAGTA
ncbi:hypothetical protein ACH4TS_12280 [Streptomyces albidoflavus]